MLLMGAGGLLVGALVVWALTRTVEPASDPVATATTASAPVAATQTEPSAIPSGTTATSPTLTATTATAPAPPQVQGDRTSVQRLAVEDLRAKMNRNEVTVVDVRDAASFRTKHIAGAINIPFASIETMLDQIPKDKPVVTYCS